MLVEPAQKSLAGVKAETLRDRGAGRGARQQLTTGLIQPHAVQQTAVTGAASGIGRATAVAAARAGAELVLTDIDSDGLQAVVERIRRHAVTPEQAAASILDGIRHRRWMVFTSPDIRIGYWFQRKWAWPFEQVMRWLNNRLYRVAQTARQDA